MAELTWDAPGDRTYSAGIDRGVFYPQNGLGVPWNGLTSVKETVDSTTQLTMYVDGQKQVNQLGLGTFAATIEAVTYPDEFLPYDGYAEPLYSGQPRQLFNFAYRTLEGDDVEGLARGYKLHLVYNCLVAPTISNHASLNASSDISLFSWSLSTTPLGVEGARASAHFVVDSQTVLPGVLSAIESYLYGTSTTDPLFPSITDFIGIFEANALYVITDNGDGSWTASGPASAFSTAPDGEVTLDWPWITFIDVDSYSIKSY